MTEFLESGLSMDAYGHWHGYRLCMDEQKKTRNTNKKPSVLFEPNQQKRTIDKKPPDVG